MKKTLFLISVVSFLLTACSRTAQPQPSPLATPTPTPITSSPETPVVESGLVLTRPNENTAVSSPLTIEGFAPGNWFFEGTIVGEIQSEAGETLTTFPLQAEGDWMTEEHVRFTGEAEFQPPKGDETIHLILKNDNPSGLPENEKSQTFILLLEQ